MILFENPYFTSDEVYAISIVPIRGLGTSVDFTCVQVFGICILIELVSYRTVLSVPAIVSSSCVPGRVHAERRNIKLIIPKIGKRIKKN